MKNESIKNYLWFGYFGFVVALITVSDMHTFFAFLFASPLMLKMAALIGEVGFYREKALKEQENNIPTPNNNTKRD